MELLEIIVCPETRQKLHYGDSDLVKRLNELVRAGRLKTRGDLLVKEEMESVLVREDGTCAYPVRSGIPVLLVEESISPE